MENNTSAYDNGKEYDANYNGGNIGSDGSAATNINDKHPSHGNKSKDNMNAEDNGKEPQPLRGRMHDIDLENTEQKEYEPPFVYKLVKTIFLVSVWITMVSAIYNTILYNKRSRQSLTGVLWTGITCHYLEDIYVFIQCRYTMQKAATVNWFKDYSYMYIYVLQHFIYFGAIF